MSKTFRYISLSDLLFVDGFAEAYSINDNKKIREILWTNGMDTALPFSIVENTHRNLRGQVVTCERYEGAERTDKHWMRSGYSSLENVVHSNDFMKDELKMVSRQGFSGQFDGDGVFDEEEDID